MEPAATAAVTQLRRDGLLQQSSHGQDVIEPSPANGQGETPARSPLFGTWNKRMPFESIQPDFSLTYTTVGDFLAGDYLQTTASADALVDILHVVNPVAAKPGSDLGIAQPVTYASMRSAQRFALQEDPKLSVRLAATVLPQDASAIPEGVTRLPDLERTVLDVASFSRPRPLPLVSDILGRARDTSARKDADFSALILTNVDIGLMPHFYLLVADLLRRGYDALIINRRTIADGFTAPDQLPLIYADLGQSHPGMDCFVISRNLVSEFVESHSCVAGGFVMRALLFNLVAHADRLRILLDAHATFHIGDATRWASLEYPDYKAFNQAEALRVFNTLSKDTVKAGRLRQFALQTNENWLPRELLGLPAAKPSALQRIKTPLRSVIKRLIRRPDSGQVR
jgi:hypothetical protein